MNEVYFIKGRNFKVNGAYYSGLAGDMLLKKKKGFTYLASDLVKEIKRLR